MLNDGRVVNTESFSDFPRSCKRVSLAGCCQLPVVSSRRPAALPLVFKALVAFSELLNPHCAACSLAVPALKC